MASDTRERQDKRAAAGQPYPGPLDGETTLLRMYPGRTIPGFSLALLVLLGATRATALGPPPQDPPVVAGFDREFRGRPQARAAGGRLLLGELGCAACHTIQTEGVTPRRAPRLKNVAARMHPAQLQAFIEDPHRTKPGTTMPDLWHGVAPAERAREAEAIAQFLISLAPGKFGLHATDEAAAARGAAHFDRLGCAACHAPNQQGAQPPAHSVPLPQMAGRYDVGQIERFLRDPLSIRPSGRMPRLNLSGREARDLAHHLLAGTEVPGALKYTLFGGPLESLDDFEERHPEATGVCDGFDPKIARRGSNYSLRFDGWLEVPRPGLYTFHLTSDDGSRMWIGGKELIDNDGVRRNHQPRTRSKAVELTAGWNALRVDYFQRGREAVLGLEWQGPDLPRAPIAASSLRSSRKAISAFEPPALDPQKVTRGRQAFVSRRCVSCHIEVLRKTEAPPLPITDPAGGCLGTTPGSHPDYHLDQEQRLALRAALGAPPPTRSEALDHDLASYNCRACHERDGRGGVPDDRDHLFTSSGQDLGDEGRLPPSLTGVGQRLQADWLREVLVERKRVRGYLHTRMPEYDAPTMERVAKALTTIDRRPSQRPKITDAIEEARAAGHRLVGTEGLACIVCHDFHRRKAPTMGVIDLIHSHERLNVDWFRSFMLEPERYHQGTRMPRFWVDGRSARTEILDGDADRQIHAIWTYLQDGERMLDPKGLSRKSLELIVGGETIVYRGKIWEAGWRGICVGHPERINLGFDAQEMRLALLWKGRFLDVSAHWRSQGMGRIRPRGTDIIVFPHGAPIARLESSQTPWPQAVGREAGFHFRGYDLDEANRPTFRYAFGGIEIEDFSYPSETDDRVRLTRNLTFRSNTDEKLWLRAGTGKKIVGHEAGGFRIDDRMTITTSVDGSLIRSATELLVPVRIQKGRANIILEYSW